jgi:hypothetical protein
VVPRGDQGAVDIQKDGVCFHKNLGFANFKYRYCITFGRILARASGKISQKVYREGAEEKLPRDRMKKGTVKNRKPYGLSGKCMIQWAKGVAFAERGARRSRILNKRSRARRRAGKRG